jgi:hypothetical protein
MVTLYQLLLVTDRIHVSFGDSWLVVEDRSSASRRGCTSVPRGSLGNQQARRSRSREPTPLARRHPGRTMPTTLQFMQTILNSVLWTGACSNRETFMLVICFADSKAAKRSVIAWQLHNGGPERLGKLSGEMTIAGYCELIRNRQTKGPPEGGLCAARKSSYATRTPIV